MAPDESTLSITAAYRQSACLLAARSIQKRRRRRNEKRNEKVATGEENIVSNQCLERTLPYDIQVAEHMLKNHPGYIPVQLTSKENSRAEKQQCEQPPSEKAAEVIFLPTCRQCGGAIQPSFEGTKMVVKPLPNMSRTARRRASRRKAVQMKRNAVKSKDQSQQQQQLSNLGIYADQSNLSAPFTTCQKNYCLLSCGCCGGTSRAPGISNPVKCRKKRKKKGNTGGSTQSKNAAGGAALAGKGETAPGEKRKKEPPKLGAPKKKKPKKAGSLLSFLSTLNDN